MQNTENSVLLIAKTEKVLAFPVVGSYWQWELIKT